MILIKQKRRSKIYNDNHNDTYNNNNNSNTNNKYQFDFSLSNVKSDDWSKSSC